jgi:glycosyltransferase involved in cell wall biosynthesis
VNAKPEDPGLSVVIPAFNEEARIGRSLDRILPYLEGRNQSWEILVVDDGSGDRTVRTVESFGNSRVRVLKNPTNRGKGYSVRRGFLEARGQWVLFTDADLSTPIEELETLLASARDGADVVIGSRAIDRSRILVHQSRFREWSGIVFNLFVRLLLRLPIRDTQCGFKLFRRSRSIRVFSLQRIPGFGFDPEILYLVRKAGLTLREVPVTWSNDAATRVRFPRDPVTMFLNLIEIRWNWLVGRYRELGTQT